MTEQKNKGVEIIKHEEQRNNHKVSESVHYARADLLKFCDGKFYRVPLDDVETIHQDRYEIIHDLVAEQFYKWNGDSEAYTSSSGIAGHHNMDGSGTLIFWRGEPVYVYDDFTEEGKADESVSVYLESVEKWEE